MPIVRLLNASEEAKLNKVTVKGNGEQSQARAEYDQLVASLPMNERRVLELGEGEVTLNVKNRVQAAVIRHNADPKNVNSQIAVVASSRRGEENKVFVTKVNASEAPPKQNKGFRKAKAAVETAEIKTVKRNKKA